MGFNLLGVDAEFQNGMGRCGAKVDRPKGHHFKNEGVVAIDLNNRVTSSR